MLAEREPDPTEDHGLGLTVTRTYVRVSEHGYTVTTHDPDRPRIVLGSEHRTVELQGRRELRSVGGPALAGVALHG
jgi:hypothetical protein